METWRPLIAALHGVILETWPVSLFRSLAERVFLPCQPRFIKEIIQPSLGQVQLGGPCQKHTFCPQSMLSLPVVLWLLEVLSKITGL